MVVEVTLYREEEKPFGFRLIGGADFELPLTISRIVEGSTAEKAGLLEGDVVVRVNEKPTINMSHEDVHRELIAAGNEFVLGVLRATCISHQQNLFELAEIGAASNDIDLKKEQEKIDEIIPDASVTDEEIAELLSGEAEVLKGHGVLGVNFKKMMPKSGVFKQSEVFQVLNDEQLKSKAEKEQEEKYHWTTFLQKPSRPPPLRATQQTPMNSYRPLIIKQAKPKCAPDYREPTPEPLVQETLQAECIIEHEEFLEDRIGVPQQTFVSEVSSQSFDTSTLKAITTFEETISFEELAAEATGEPLNSDFIMEDVKNQEDEVSVVSSAFAEQLINVQAQLLALSHLPKTIQSSLDEITKQLQCLIPPSKLKQKSPEPEIEEQDANVLSDGTKVDMLSTNLTIEQNIIETTEMKEEDLNKIEIKDSSNPLDKDEIEEFEESKAKFRELWEKKREKQVVSKDARADLSVELKQRVGEDKTMKQKKAKGFRGLQPQERPIFLPGGRKWRNSKDAWNESMIAEIISSQAELIMGQTLGSEYESPFLKFDERVNFLKYQKPEKDLSFLKNSETYRTIHHMNPVENGIEKRSSFVAAEADILKSVSPTSLAQKS